MKTSFFFIFLVKVAIFEENQRPMTKKIRTKLKISKINFLLALLGNENARYFFFNFVNWASKTVLFTS